jgi:alpha-N-arabinofuranosidase
MLSASIYADTNFVISPLDRRLFGTFVEHLGRCVYGGIYEPGHPTADAQGFRGDVMALTRELGPTIVRYPGGNFLSGYNWEDGVGPKDQRPTKLDLAWGTTETNEFGTNEFIDWCRAADVEPMFAVNLGTRGADEARCFLEYCNHPGGSYYADLRRAHGYEAPHDIKFWCLGNEMDGPWQICQKTANEYGRIAQETAKAMRMLDKSLVLAACGSSQREMATYAAWEHEVLTQCFNQVDFISLHAYFKNEADDIETYFTSLEDLNFFIREVAAIADAVASQKRSTKRIMLSLDEWNVWYKARTPADLKGVNWEKAPKLLEEIYTFEDALIVGGALIVMMNNADRVKTACLAQLVNVIGAIFTETGGAAWRQTIFHPFALASRLGHGVVLQPRVQTEGYATETHPFVPYLLSTVLHNPETGEAVVFALNRSTSEEMDLTIDLRGVGERLELRDAVELHHDDLKAINSKASPDEVSPNANARVSIEGSRVAARLKPQSWNVIHLAGA